MPARFTDAERALVEDLSANRAVNFEAIGAALAKFGPTAITDFDGDIIFCGTMRRYTQVYRLFGGEGPLEEVVGLREVGEHLQ